MTNSKKSLIFLLVAVLFMGLAAFSNYRVHVQKQEQTASDLCWVKGGTYVDGTCHMPQKSETQVRIERACGTDNAYIMEGDPAVYCINDKHGLYKVEP
jgi:hypothetical protein